MTVRPVFRPSRKEEGHEAGTLVLRDGSHLPLARALPEDAQRIAGLFGELTDDEHEQVLQSLDLGSDEDLRRFLEQLAGGGEGEAFFAEADGAGRRVAAFAAYRCPPDTPRATVALAVVPGLRQRGIATLLLERLVVLASRRGVDRLEGHVPASDEALLDLFQREGFERTDGAPGPGLLRLSLDLRTAAGAVGTLAERAFAAASLKPLFFPRSVAVVGASRTPGTVGHTLVRSLVLSAFGGPVYPVNPKADHVASVRAYPDLAAIGAPVDLVVIVVPAPVVPAVVEEAIAAGARGLIVVTAGFAEVGERGAEAQRQLVERIREHGLRMVGPNCLGMIHTHPEVRLNASFAPQMPDPGVVALCSQSGALGVAIIALTRRLGLGLSSFVSVGNKADVSGNDLLEYWEEDPATQVVLFYLESFGNPRRFARIARRVGRSKPIVVVKAGRSEAGGRAASSHTAALGAADTAVEALFEQTGILRADTLEEMFDVARALASQPLPPGRRVAVVTNAGGPAILATDALEAAGLVIEPLSRELQAELSPLLPPEASTANPVDMIAAAGPEAYREVVARVLAADEVDALVVINTPVPMVAKPEIRQAIVDGVRAGRARGGTGKPVFASIVGSDEEIHQLAVPGPESEERAGPAEQIPVYVFPEAIGRLLGKISRYAEWRAADPGVFPEPEGQDLETAGRIARRALDERGEGWLSTTEGRDLLAAAGLTMARGGLATSEDEAVETADRVGYPVAAKLASLEIVHKTEVGGVHLDLADAAAVRRAWRETERRLAETGQEDAMAGLLVQEMIEGALEVMIGSDVDPVFGPVVAFGLGGIHVEILRDVTFRVAPLTDRDAAEMVRGIKGFRLLEGYRGAPAADVPALEDAVLRLSRLVEAVPEIRELDLNPVFACPPGEGYRIVDARVKVAAPARGA